MPLNGTLINGQNVKFYLMHNHKKRFEEVEQDGSWVSSSDDHLHTDTSLTSIQTPNTFPRTVPAFNMTK